MIQRPICRLMKWSINLPSCHPKWLASQVGNMVTAFLLAGLFFVLNDRGLTVEVIPGTLSLWIRVEII